MKDIVANVLEDAHRRALAALERREDEPELGPSSADRARRSERLRVANVPIEEHIRTHVILDDLEATPALDVVRPIVRAAQSGYGFASFVGLLGERGRGKTVAMAWAIATLGGRYVKLERAAQLRNRTRVADEHEWERVLASPVLAVDELGAERDPVEGILALHEVVDERQSHNRITLLASNLDLAALERRYDRRTFDRLRSQWRAVELVGESYRRRRPWYEILKLPETERRAAVITARAREKREFLLAKAAAHENLVELMWARDVALAIARTEAA